ncbi:AAA family ATPase [Streptomyces sp. HUAS TT20]|uniref:AAA family ATPase n=1 Tax=Streptomyces sp. HUAS TT20 TaxID=3447509 RepID=UPI0021DB3886|nr:AAA family ATPase [Streptomyces sp. HUAS 15-9]UXY29675.1 AAA family ATPase [Streptomyces sp. HUAS 15-9]
MTTPADSTPRDGRTALPEAWMREVDLSLSLAPHLLLTGNVRDLHQLPVPEGAVRLVTLQDVLWEVCRARGYGALLTLDPLRGLERVDDPEDPRAPAPRTEDRRTADARIADLLKRYEGTEFDSVELRGLLVALHDLFSGEDGLTVPVALVVPYAAHALPSDTLMRADRTLFTAIEALGHTAPTIPMPGRPGERAFGLTLIWVCEQQDHLPSAFPVASDSVRVIRLLRPNLDRRTQLAARFVRRVFGAEAQEEELKSVAGATDGMTARQVHTTVRTAATLPPGPTVFSDAARLVRVGITDDPWAGDAVRRQLAGADAYLSRRVLGQPTAVRKTVDVLTRAAVGLTGAQSSAARNRPRGVLFLAGPTGVGKTELARAVTTLLLGEEAQPVRFDMSEFRVDESRQRLIGAPPGYVGYDSGGELTNAVRAQPACVLLFDEIEKAHERILDLFLQILDDGRLTDSRGSTVYFSECFIIFTSNLGTQPTKEGNEKENDPDAAVHRAEELLQQFTHSPDAYFNHFRAAYEDFFDRKIGRPELRNRLGDNYVTLGFIDKEAASRVLDRSLDSVVTRVRTVHKTELVVSPDARHALMDAAVAKLGLGARGILNLVESSVVNPLSRELFHRPRTEGSRITLSDLIPENDENDGWRPVWD